MTPGQISIPCSIIRGGTSRGLYFDASDLSTDPAERDRVLLAVIGGPDALQVDGVGGGHPLTNKIAVVGPSSRPDADVDYLFLQAVPERQQLSDAQNCGNLLAGVGPFVIESGMLGASDPETRIRVYMRNSDSLCELVVQTPGGIVQVSGDTAIDGVPGTGAPIVCNYADTAGSATGKLLPTGKLIDVVDGLPATFIDNGMPVVILQAADLDCSGYESPEELERNEDLKRRLEAVRLRLGVLAGLGDVSANSIPKICLVAPPQDGGVISTRMLIPHRCHRSIGVLAAVSVATACLLDGSVPFPVAARRDGDQKLMDIEHPGGSLSVRLETGLRPNGAIEVHRAGIVRTARVLMRGEARVPTAGQ
jgi:4-oxalomesaconate tautomerase